MKFGLCPDHYNKLDENNKQELHNLYKNSVDRNDSTKSLFLIPLIGIFLLILFAFFYVPSFSKGISQIIFLIVMLLITVLVPLVFKNIRNRHEKELFKFRVRTFFVENKQIDIHKSEILSQDAFFNKKKSNE